MSNVRVLLDNLVFPECPRWHAGRLWFSDMHDGKIYSIASGESAVIVCEVPGHPGGLGWLPDGRLQIVSMTDRKLLRREETGQLVEVADLSRFFEFNANDMVVDIDGRAYIGTFGFDLDGGGEPTASDLVCVEPDGEAWVVVENLLFPNGMVVSDGTLIVAESFGQRLSAYDLQPDGSVANPRVWADLRPNVPDGICLDAEGAVWVADPVNNGVMRVVEGAGAVDWISTGDRGAYGCCLGGTGLKTLFICTAETSDRSRTTQLRSGRIEAAVVDVPGAGG